MYIDALEEREKGIIRVVERRGGRREYLEYPADYSFYIKDQGGSHRSIFGDKLKKITPGSYTDLMKAKNSMKQFQTFESDVNYVFRCIEQHYEGTDTPNPHVAFFDIEVDFDKDLGYSSPEDAFNPITSISVYLQWLDQMVCIAVPPKTLTKQQAQEIADEVGDTIIADSEEDLLKLFLTLIEDADILSGWNSRFYDIPYTVHRIIAVLGKYETRKLCLWNKIPQKKHIVLNDKKNLTYMLFGRVHLDYLELYKKYNYEERVSYALDFISERELGERKVPYEGTLDQLYNQDFKKFLEYNIQDTMLLHKLDQKLKYLDLAISIAHSNDVLLDTAMGTVLMVEQAITSEAHKRGMIVPDAKPKSDQREENEDLRNRAAGGWVEYREPGLHKWVGSTDLASLYPSVIRTLNMSPETLIGQLSMEETFSEICEFVGDAKKPAKRGQLFAEWWNNRFNTLEMQRYLDSDMKHKMAVHFEGQETVYLTGAELKQLIVHGGGEWCISANGTIFRTDIEGVIPGLLTRWYRERQTLQGIKGQVIQILDGKHDCNFKIDNNKKTAKTSLYDFRTEMLDQTLETGEEQIINKFFVDWGLTVNEEMKIVPNQQSRSLWSAAAAYWDKQQLVKKINLNSAYGGILNPHMKFFDQRIGQSTTLTGRSITRHMTAKTNELLAGEYDHDGVCVIYNDTDSTYFSAWPVIKDDVESGNFEWNRDIAVELYDSIGKEVSDTFPQYMKEAFNTPKRLGINIKSEREIVAETGLFIKKKRYACLVYDKEGSRKDVNGKPGQIKAMGLDSRRSDTPEFMQKFLSDILVEVLAGVPEEEIMEKIKNFRQNIDAMKPWEKGIPKAVNKVSYYAELEEEFLRKRMQGIRASKPSIPGHVAASKNWNLLREKNHDMFSMKIVDGSKVVVCDLKTNVNGMTSIAYPIDENRLPAWFIELPFDDDAMVQKILDQKLQNLLGVLKWDLDKTKVPKDTFDQFFG